MRAFKILIAASLVGCTSAVPGEGESVGTTAEALNGVLSSEGFLTATGDAVTSDNEVTRRFDTLQYYASVRTTLGPTGQGFGTISTGLQTLQDFRDAFDFDDSLVYDETITYYYNRGDLGLGREMHCIPTIHGESACYVTNYAAGDDFGEFTFGLSSNIAFKNMNSSPPKVLATVAMVFRPNAAAGRDQMLFMAYDANGNLTYNAPLDRHGINFANGFDAAGGVNPDPDVFGTPGVNFNNHIPSNCITCHGGTYTTSPARSVSGAVFLPWDLDQFEYDTTAGRTRDDQEDEFRSQNAMAINVAEDVLGTTSPLVNQVKGWYGSPAPGFPLSGDFDSSYVPSGWSSEASVYYNVVRRSCRSCHLVTLASVFDSASTFAALASSSVADIQSHKMPHALQTQREFWLSSQPQQLEQFFRDNGQSTAANSLRDARPGNVVTLDPYVIATVL